MADDIDIEEHDVLDNPVIRSIFPDISVIKKEISQYYEDGQDIKQEPEVNKQNEDPSKDKEQSMPTAGPVIVDKCSWNRLKESPQKLHLSKILAPNSKSDYTPAQIPLLTNKIILGSKPVQTKDTGINSKQTNNVVRLPKVILQDLGAYIYRNNRYCKDCLTLFPSRSDCEEHKRNFHSVLIKTRNKPLSVIVTLDKPSFERVRHKCNICSTHFSCRANLSRHIKNLHKKKVTFKSKYTKSRSNSSRVPSITKRALVQKKSASKNDEVYAKIANSSENNKGIKERTLMKQTSKISRNKCNVCGSYFSSSGNLTRHYRNIHLRKVSFKPKHKRATSSGLTDLSHAINITRSRTNSTSKSDKNICFHCKKMFPDQTSLVEHIYKVLEPKPYPKRQQNKNKNMTTIPPKSCNVQEHEQRESKCYSKDKQTFNKRQTNTSLKSLYTDSDIDENPRQSINETKSKTIHKKEKTTTQPKKKHIVSDISKHKKPNIEITYTKDKNVDQNQLKRKHSDSETDENQKSNRNQKQDREKENLNNKKNTRKRTDLGEKRAHLGSQSLKSKLMFESEDSDDNDFQYSECADSNDGEKPETKVTLNKNKNVLQQEESVTGSNKDTDKSINSNNLKILQPKLKLKNRDIDLNNGSQSTAATDKGRKEGLYGSKQLKKTLKLKNKEICLHPAESTKNNHTEAEIVSAKATGVKSNETHVDNRFIFECKYCSYMLPSARAYFMHVGDKHNVKTVSLANKVVFDEQCKYCPSKSSSESAHNKHLYAYHHDLVYKNFPGLDKQKKERKNINLKIPTFELFESFALKSIIYKCSKCDIHFLSSCIAKDHAKHMELLVHWKCTICKKIFKKHDKYLHLKQHNFSRSLNVCQFNEIELSTLLYNCTKCAIHFTEERYLEHYSKCDEETTDSVYCKKCDILIDKGGYKCHETYHDEGKNINDFTVVVADIIEVAKKSTNEDVEINIEKKRKRRYEQVNCLTFCQTCNCYLSDVALTRKSHIEARCSEIPKYICSFCGLVLTNKALGTHRDHHKRKSDLNLQDFKFFNLKGIQINPPIPNYPQCNNCEVHFMSRNAVKSHICTEIEYMTCNLCNIKLSEIAFKLHMDFHNYSMLNVNKEASQVVINLKSQEQETETAGSKDADLKSNTVYQPSNTREVHTADSNEMHLVYSCYSCKVTVDEFDKVIEHCQNHYSPKSKSYSTLMTCSKCSVQLESDIYENHQRLHSRQVIITVLKFDPMYFTSDNNTWVRHIFASVPQSIQKEVVGQSIYQHESRIKMKVVQKGPSYLTVYKCDKCGNFIDPDCLFAHVKEACPKNIRKHPCSVCGLPFMSTVFRSKHEKIHRRYDNVRIKTYNIVLINSETDNIFTANILTAMKHYVLYQCRTCEGVVDKWQRTAHQCNVDALLKCSKCRLLVDKEDFERHICKHNDLVEFRTANIKVIVFGTNNESNQNKTLSPSFDGTVNDYTLYKCAQCEACVHNEVSISKHLCEMGDSKWRCPKCDFFICASLSLNQHLKMHDVDAEFNKENIKVIQFNENETDMNQTKEKTHSFHNDNKIQECELKSNVDCAINMVEPISNPDESKATSDKHSDVIEERALPVYKCSCGLHYMDESNAKKHVENCTPKNKVIKQSCSKCSMVFNPKELFSHLIAHHGDKNKTYTYEVIEILPEKENTFVE